MRRLAKKTIDNCTVIKSAIKEGLGFPDLFGDKCGGYANSGEEPYEACDRCKLYEGYGEG